MTAVEYLVEQLLPKALSAEQYYHIQQAKEIEKQQIIEAHGDKKKIKTNPDSILPHGYTLTGEMYYNEKFKK